MDFLGGDDAQSVSHLNSRWFLEMHEFRQSKMQALNRRFLAVFHVDRSKEFHVGFSQR